MKILAVCHHLNLGLATVSSAMVSVLTAVILVVSKGSFNDVAQMPQIQLYTYLVFWPIGVFLLAYFFGHLCGSKTFWFDQVCVDQVNALVKVQTLRAIPAFIAQSTDMIVLWDDTVFERLWCNYELAVHAKTSASSCAFKLVPIWEPAWNLAWLASWFAFGCSIDPSQRQLLAWDPSSEWSLFGSFWKTYYVSPVPFLVASVPCTWLCLQRFKHHKLMLDQMSHFELRDAKCTLETDRILIMEQILGLFDEALEPPVSVSFETTDSAGTTEQHSAQTEEDHPLISPSDIEEIRGITSYPTKEEIMDLFNAYVRGPLRDTVVRSTGRGDHVPFTLCIGACLPVFFTALATVFDCDGLGDCHRAAAHCGYPSVSRYMLGNVVIDLFLQQLFWGICCPLVVRTNGLATRVVSGHWSQMLLGSLLCAGLLYLTCCLSLVECGMVVVLFAKNSLLCLFGSTVGLMLLLVVYWRLFPCPEIWRSVIRQMR